MFGFPLIEYSGTSYSVDECMDKCFSLMHNGYACSGFEYSLGNSTCRFLEANFQNDATKYYITPYWDHYMLGSTTRKITSNLHNPMEMCNYLSFLIFN